MNRRVEAVDVADASNLCLNQERSAEKRPTASPVIRNLLQDSGSKSELQLTGSSITSQELYNPVKVSSGLHTLARAFISFSISTPLTGTYVTFGFDRNNIFYSM